MKICLACDSLSCAIELAGWRSPEGSTCLHVACESSRTLVVKELLQRLEAFPAVRGYLINSRDSIGLTPLHICCKRGMCKEVELLLMTGADPNTLNNLGVTALMSAAGAVNGLALCQLLCAYGANRHLGALPLALCITTINSISLRPWLLRTDLYASRMHFFEYISEEECVSRLRRGEHIGHRLPCIGAFSPMDLAIATPELKNAAIVLKAAARWSPATHHLCSRETRRRARALVIVGHLLAKTYSRLLDVWIELVIPRVLGPRIANEQWSKTLLATFFVQRLLCKSRLVCQNVA